MSALVASPFKIINYFTVLFAIVISNVRKYYLLYLCPLSWASDPWSPIRSPLTKIKTTSESWTMRSDEDGAGAGE